LYVPRPDIEQVQESSADHQLSTYISSGAVREEYGVVDLYVGTTGINSTALEVACPPPGHGRKIRKILETITPQLTLPPAVFVSKVESWMTRVPSPWKIAPPCYKLHVARRELERKFEIVLSRKILGWS
jgi:hypothetical protein